MHQRMIRLINVLLLGGLLSASLVALAEERKVDIYQLTHDAKTQGIGAKIGTITFKDSPDGLVIITDLQGLTPGDHGFHIHQMPACEGEEKDGIWVPGAAAGPHLDPKHTEHHLGPYEHGHLGDLPVLVVDKAGKAKDTLIAPHLKVADITHHSVIIHIGGDNYSDEPKPLGGGGERIACGRIH